MYSGKKSTSIGLSLIITKLGEVRSSIWFLHTFQRGIANSTLGCCTSGVRNLGVRNLGVRNLGRFERSMPLVCWTTIHFARVGPPIGLPSSSAY
jgi:hypothetical protein